MTCLRVFKRLQIPVLYTCVEKNPLAVTTLRKKATSLSTWKGNVRVFEMDVRDWVEKWLAGDRNVHEEEAPPLFDMLLSELLGSLPNIDNADKLVGTSICILCALFCFTRGVWLQ